jgi:hypothetical protein
MKLDPGVLEMGTLGCPLDEVRRAYRPAVQPSRAVSFKVGLSSARFRDGSRRPLDPPS